jgi:hypothetical protein
MFFFVSCITHIFCSTFGDAWTSILKVHEVIGNQRIKFASTISDAAEDIISLGRSIEKERKKVCDLNILQIH